MENLENRLQRVEKALQSLTAPTDFEDNLTTGQRKHMFDSTFIQRIPEGKKEQGKKKKGDICLNSYLVKKSVSHSAPYTSDMSHIDRFTINEIGQAIYVNDIKSRVDRIPNENSGLVHNDTHSDISDSPTMSSSTTSFLHPPTIITTQPEAPLPDHLSSRIMVSEVQPLTEAYFDHVHKYVPMIHKPSFLKQMHSPTNPPSRLLLYAMCAVASRWTPDHLSYYCKTNMAPAGYTYYQRALDILDEFTDAPRVSTVQALVLIVKYQESFQRTGFFHRSLVYLNMAARMSQDLGFSEVDHDSPEAETKRRTFWIIFMYDLLMSIEGGHTPYFRAQACKIGFPSVTGEEGPALEEYIMNQNILIQLGKVISHIYTMAQRMAIRQQSQGDQRSQEQTIEEQTRLFSLHTHLENFLYEVPSSLAYQPTQDIESYPVEKQVITNPFVAFLHMTYHLGVILLHRIYLSLPPPATEFNLVSYPHRQLCAASASNITMLAETLFERYPTFTFHYPIRGVQHTIHCLSSAITIHKYEMIHNQDAVKQEAAKRQYMISLNIIQHLSNESPCIELVDYFNQQTTVAEKRMSVPLQVPMMMYNNPPEKGNRVRRNTLSSSTSIPMDDTALYQSSALIAGNHYIPPEYTNPPRYNTFSHAPIPQQWQIPPEEVIVQQPYRRPFMQMPQQWNQPIYYDYPPSTEDLDMISPPQGNHQGRIRRHTVSNPSQQPYFHEFQQHVKTEPGFVDTSMGMMTAGQEDTMMMDSTQPHYDPTPEMSQLYLTDDQIHWDNNRK